MFQFVTDRKPQGTLSGPFRPIADQTQFRSIYGVVDGPLVGPWTGDMIENGEIYSADGKARLGGAEVKDAKGKPHDVKVGNTTFREYQIPAKAVEQWNKYEAKQGNEQVKAFTESARQRALSKGFSDPKPELQIEHIDVTPASILEAQAAMEDEPAPEPRKPGRPRKTEAAPA